MYKIKILKQALSDIDEIKKHYHNISKNLCDRFLFQLEATITGLKGFCHYQIRYKDIRLRQIKGFPILIHFRFIEWKTQSKFMVSVSLNKIQKIILKYSDK